MEFSRALAICEAMGVRRIDLDHVDALYKQSNPEITPGAYKLYSKPSGTACPIFMLLQERKGTDKAAEVLQEWACSSDMADDPVAAILNLDSHYLAGFSCAVGDSLDGILAGNKRGSDVPAFARVAIALRMVGAADGQAYVDRFLDGVRR